MIIQWPTVLAGSGVDILGNVASSRLFLQDVWNSDFINSIVRQYVGIFPDVFAFLWSTIPFVILFSIFFSFFYMVFIRPIRRFARL